MTKKVSSGSITLKVNGEWITFYQLLDMYRLLENDRKAWKAALVNTVRHRDDRQRKLDVLIQAVEFYMNPNHDRDDHEIARRFELMEKALLVAKGGEDEKRDEGLS